MRCGAAQEYELGSDAGWPKLGILPQIKMLLRLPLAVVRHICGALQVKPAFKG